MTDDDFDTNYKKSRRTHSILLDTSLICGRGPRLLWGGGLVTWLQPLNAHEKTYRTTMLLHLDNVL
jgi:hypothetical protein